MNEGESLLGLDFVGRVYRNLELERKVFRGSQGMDKLSDGSNVLAKGQLGKFCSVMGKNSKAPKPKYILHFQNWADE